MRFYFLLFIGAFAADMMTKTWIDQHPELAESELACTNGYIGVKPLDNSGFAGGRLQRSRSWSAMRRLPDLPFL